MRDTHSWWWELGRESHSWSACLRWRVVEARREGHAVQIQTRRRSFLGVEQILNLRGRDGLFLVGLCFWAPFGWGLWVVACAVALGVAVFVVVGVGLRVTVDVTVVVAPSSQCGEPSPQCIECYVLCVLDVVWGRAATWNTW